MVKYIAPFFVWLFFSCAGEERKMDQPGSLENELSELKSEEIRVFPYESKVDSIIYQSLFAWNEQLIGIASPTNDDIGKRGLRLQLLEMNEDSSLTLINQSSYGYDSRTFFPSFFKISNRKFVLVNTGERESWGNKIMELKDNEFIDMGFIDAATAKSNGSSNAEEAKYRHGNIAEIAQFNEYAGGIEINFIGDSVVLFDDGNGGYDLIRGANQIQYRLLGDQFKLQTNY